MTTEKQAPTRLPTRFARRFAIVSAGRVFSALLQAGSFAILARLLGAAKFGLFSLTVSAVLIFATVLEFGFGTRALRLAADEEAQRSINTILLVRLGSALPIIGLTAVVVEVISGHLSYFVIGVATYMAGDLYANLVGVIAIGIGREILAIVMLLVRRVVLVLALALALTVGGDDHRVLLVTATLGSVGMASYVTGLGVVALRAKLHPIRQFISENRRYWLAGVGTNIQQADVIVVGAIGGDALAGYYGAAARLNSPLALLTSSMLQTVVPSLAASGQSQREILFRRLIRLAIAYAFLLTAIATLSYPITFVLYGRDFLPAWTIVAGMFISSAFDAINQAYFASFYADVLPVAVGWIVASASCLALIGVGISSARASEVGMAISIAGAAGLETVALALVHARTSQPHGRHRQQSTA